MKVIKPQRLGVLHRVFEDDGECYFVVTVLAFFSLSPSPRLLSEVDLWKFLPAELGESAVLDLGMPKPKGEILVTGKAYPRGRPQPVCAVKVRLGPIDKTLWVVGDRQWRHGGQTDPVPFDEMPIAWERAFGGEGYAQNPVGKGFPQPKGSADAQPLPNVEDPRHLVKSPGDRPAPAGFGPYDLTWPQRFSKVGTYDKKWLEERFPSFASDMDLGIFNAAPDDQQVDGYLRGDEAMVLENMHPDRPVLEATLPGVAARAFINQATPGGDAFREVAMHLETVHLFPHAERFVLIFRGVVTVLEDDAADVRQLVVAAEALGEPKPPAHYSEVLRQRLDPKKGHLFSLREQDLLPPLPPGQPARPETDVDEMTRSDRLVEKHLAAGQGRRDAHGRREVREKLAAIGVDPAVAPEPDVEPLPDPDDLASFVDRMEARVEKERAEAEGQRAKAEEDARAAFARGGIDYDAARGEHDKAAAGPPKFSAAAERERLQDLAELVSNAGYPNAELEATLADPELDRKLSSIEAQMREGYRLGAHHNPTGAPRLAGDAAAALREEVLAALRERRSLAGRDLTGVDLHGLDLRGADLTGALLESAGLAGADLRDARLGRAVLSRADLSGAKLAGADLEDANLGKASLAGADLTGANLSEATFYQADLTGAILRGADLTMADLSEAKLAGADLEGASAQLLKFIRTDLAGVRFVEADLCRCNFIECTANGVDFSRARMISTAFVGVTGRGAIFRGANLEKLRMVQDCAFDEADFQGATLTLANLRGTRLAGAVLSESTLNGADLSGCDLRGAKLRAIVAREARFIRADLTDADLTDADLMLAVLQKARVAGADFTRANLFRADLAKVEGDERTRMTDANVAQVRFVQRRPRGQG